MQRLLAIGLAIAAASMNHAAARAESYDFTIDIHRGSLAASLRELARQTGIELIFDRDLLKGRMSPALEGKLAVDAALTRLLASTDLAARRAASGAWIIEQRAAPDAPPRQDLAVPEILIVGRRTQDVDIRRRENDIQPYHVVTGEEISRAHRDDLDGYFRSRVTANTVVSPPSLGQTGDTNSEIDLRGLGSGQTLILIDGRRMPGVPESASIDFGQPDINAIPLHAIDRVETLTGTAGGIYGFGALGGVVNVVLRRDLRGLEFHASSGISSRGDARRLQLEGGAGFSPDNGRTTVMIYLSRSWQQPLLQGQRGLTLRGREAYRKFASPDDFSSESIGLESDAVGVFTQSYPSTTLVLKPEYGGTSLGSDRTFLATGFSGSRADLVASLLQHAGQVELHPSSTLDSSYLIPTATTTSAISEIRHRFGDGVEAYFDALYLRNRGKLVDHNQGISEAFLAPSLAINPFQNYIYVVFPGPPQNRIVEPRYISARYTLGMIASLPLGWRATAEASLGSMHYDDLTSWTDAYSGPLFPKDTQSPDFNPFGNWARFQESLKAYLINISAPSTFTLRNHFSDQSVRLAGPLFQTRAGPTTLTLLTEHRREAMPFATGSTLSAYAELHAPLIDRFASLPLLKGLEIQLALRRDDQRDRFSTSYSQPDTDRNGRARFASTTLTAGFKFYPLARLMLRGSYATGEQPPALTNLVDTQFATGRYAFMDPKRGNDFGFEGGDVILELGGNPSLKAIHARTLALGAVFNPDGDHGPRISVDFSHIRRTNDYYHIGFLTIINNEDLFPDRVTRAPLTDDDRAKGYTGGLVTTIDARAANGGRLDVETIDGRMDWNFPFAAGTLHLASAATLQLRNEQRDLLGSVTKLAGYVAGPLRWRANGGGDWSVGRTTIGTNLQFFSRYRIQVYGSDLAKTYAQAQGSEFVHAQLYLDLSASRRFRTHWAGSDHEMSLDFGIVDLFDHAPPYQTNGSLGLPLTGGDDALYSRYGDPRRRRVELTLNASF